MDKVLHHLFHSFGVVHAGVLILAAMGFFAFWARTRFWLPKYVHVLAALGLLGGLWCIATMPLDAPINQYGPFAKILLALVLPALVYFFFVFYGGQQTAFKSRFGGSNLCPRCGLESQHAKNGDNALKQCSRCGQALTSESSET